MSILSVSLFGKFHAQLGEQVLTSLNACKAQELFCYLLLYRDRPHRRETLADMLWGATSTTQSKRYLRKALWQLQAALDTQTEPLNSRLLVVDLDWVQLNLETDLWLDVAVFEQAFPVVASIPRVTSRCLRACSNAMPPMPGMTTSLGTSAIQLCFETRPTSPP